MSWQGSLGWRRMGDRLFARAMREQADRHAKIDRQTNRCTRHNKTYINIEITARWADMFGAICNQITLKLANFYLQLNNVKITKLN
jgi:hypothetical protein